MLEAERADLVKHSITHIDVETDHPVVLFLENWDFGPVIEMPREDTDEEVMKAKNSQDLVSEEVDSCS